MRRLLALIVVVGAQVFGYAVGCASHADSKEARYVSPDDLIRKCENEARDAFYADSGLSSEQAARIFDACIADGGGHAR